MNYDAVPPKWPSVLDYFTRPVAAEIRQAPSPSFIYVGSCSPTPPRKTVERDEDPPKMLRVFLATTATSTMDHFSCAAHAVITGQPYTVDVRLDAESGAIIERMNHDYALHYTTISTS